VQLLTVCVLEKPVSQSLSLAIFIGTGWGSGELKIIRGEISGRGNNMIETPQPDHQMFFEKPMLSPVAVECSEREKE
jgi:hypothetical protein